MKNLNTTDDHELLRLTLAGHEEAFTTLYRRRSGLVHRFASRMCGGANGIAEDVTQDVFMILMKDGDRFDHTRASLTTWLLGITRNQVLRRINSDRSMVPMPVEFEDGGEIASRMVTESDQLGNLTRAEMIENVRQAVTTLPPHYREVVILCDLEEISYADAANILDCAVGTVRSRLHRARGMLVDRLRSLKTHEKSPVQETSVRNLL
ncbi:MAG: RNA polymerase sigma factor [Acidobacteria bacterium]|nr:RNA polymerase sigma factor [Acidobacteriota bacterium]